LWVEEVEEYLLSVSAVVGDEVSAGELVVSWACSVDLLVEGWILSDPDLSPGEAGLSTSVVLILGVVGYDNVLSGDAVVPGEAELSLGVVPCSVIPDVFELEVDVSDSGFAVADLEAVEVAGDEDSVVELEDSGVSVLVAGVVVELAATLENFFSLHHWWFSLQLS
jgi:hypothetical protein